jgi:hypothetical protein
METTATRDGESSFTWRRCLWLCLPALLIGAALRISFLLAVPQALYGSDSNSYYSTASDLWLKHRFNLSEKRRYIYPVVEVVLTALPGSPVVWTAVLQHAVGLATVVGIGWIAGQLTRRPGLWVPVVTAAAAIWPRMLWFEHEMIAESLLLFAYVLTVALALPLTRLRTSRGLFWFLLAALCVIAMKPHGRPIWMGVLVVAAIYLGRGVRLRWPHLAVLGLSLVVALMPAKRSQGSWLLLSSAMPLVKLEGERFREYREILRPHVEAARADLKNYATNQSIYKKMLNNKENLGPAWGELVRDLPAYNRVAKGLAIEAILAQPFTYAAMVVRKIFWAAAKTTAGEMIPPAAFWEKQDGSSAGRWEKNPAEMRLVYNMDRAEYDEMRARERTRKLWFEPAIGPVSEASAWTYYLPAPPGASPRYGFTVIGWLALFGWLACFRPSGFVARALVWFPPLFYYGIIFSVGDAVTRYLHPVDWCWLVVIAIGGDFLCDVAASAARALLPASQRASTGARNVQA